MKPEEPSVMVAIYLRGDQLDPDYVTQALGIQPSKSQKKGNMRPGKKPTMAKIGIWAIIAQTDSLAVTDHIDELLIKLEMPRIALDKIAHVDEAYLDIFIFSGNDNCTKATVDFMLSKRYMDELNRLGLSIQFTVT